ncbi:MAG: circularly permuted type 2 ATP-grasp protein [Rhizobiaceae bacterium]|nr:circularly permuted type 2 ATP-grasp protein [Rhizobiaceae bacterium]
MSRRGATRASRNNPLIEYSPIEGAIDELMTADGQIRPVWQSFIDHLSSLREEEVALRLARGDEYLRDAGVFFRQYGQKDSVERAWPLSHIPVLIQESEWEQISAGLIQRADLLEAIAADMYGPNTLVRDGYLPPSLIATNPEWLRPAINMLPQGRHYLNFAAVDIGRGPDGRWWVLQDRTQAPSGAGFALENRVATSRVFSEFYADANIHRLAGFFRAFRDALYAMRTDDTSRVGILTPGQHNDTYYEHAYIARYLGLMLLEGEDLVVADGKVMVRTVSGNHPISVLWRRLDASYADPLELNGASKLGVPGLVAACRRGSVTLVNALGSGVLECPGLFAFLPRIAQHLLGAPLAMPNVATWWCGDAAARREVAANLERVVMRSAFPNQPLPSSAAREFGTVDVNEAAVALQTMSDRSGSLLVAQEAVTLSTTPVMLDGKLRPRPASLRIFLARTSGGWQVMPGGFARIGKTSDPSAMAMQHGGSVADVWVVSDQPVKPDTMLPAETAPYVRPQLGSLPSRAADNLFWLGRYVERAEATLRLLRAYHTRLAEAGFAETPLLVQLTEFIEENGIDPEQCVPGALRDDLAFAIGSAGKVRDRFSIDGWMALNDLAETATKLARTVTPGYDTARAMGVLLRKITGFSGLVHENMYRFTGWRFLSIGRSLERAVNMCSLLATFADQDAAPGSLDLAIEVGDSTMSHRRRYAVNTTRATVIDLLGLDTMNPRSILYHLSEVREQIARLPRLEHGTHMTALSRAVLQLHTDIAVRRPEEVESAELAEYGEKLMRISDVLTDTYLR